MNKGFTFMELLAVIAIIALVSMITVNVSSRQVRNSKNVLYNNQLSSIKMAASLWGSDNKDQLELINDCLTLSLGYLKQEGYVDVNMKNPLTNEEFDNDEVFVNIERVNHSYKYTVITDKTLMCEDVMEENQ